MKRLKNVFFIDVFTKKGDFMGNVRKFFLSVCFLILSEFCFCQQISFQIVQHDSFSNDITEQSLIIEDELVGMFFENGFIVTNSPTVSSSTETQDETFWKTGLKDAKDGFSDYFVQIKLYFSKKNKNDEKSVFNKAEWTLVSAKNGKELKKNTVKTSKSADINEDLYLVTENIFNEIKKAI